MGIENSDKWKKAKSNTDKLLKNAKNAESLAGDIKIEGNKRSKFLKQVKESFEG